MIGDCNVILFIYILRLCSIEVCACYAQLMTLPCHLKRSKMSPSPPSPLMRMRRELAPRPHPLMRVSAWLVAECVIGIFFVADFYVTCQRNRKLFFAQTVWVFCVTFIVSGSFFLSAHLQINETLNRACFKRTIAFCYFFLLTAFTNRTSTAPTPF